MGIYVKITKINEDFDVHDYEVVHNNNTIFVRLIPSLKKMIFCYGKEFTMPFLYWYVDNPLYEDKSLKECFEPGSDTDNIDQIALMRAFIKGTNALRNNVFPKYMDHCCG